MNLDAQWKRDTAEVLEASWALVPVVVGGTVIILGLAVTGLLAVVRWVVG